MKDSLSCNAHFNISGSFITRITIRVILWKSALKILKRMTVACCNLDDPQAPLEYETLLALLGVKNTSRSNLPDIGHEMREAHSERISIVHQGNFGNHGKPIGIWSVTGRMKH